MTTILNMDAINAIDARAIGISIEGDSTYVAIINPFGDNTLVTIDVSATSDEQIAHYVAHMDDEERALCEMCGAGTNAAWVDHMVEALGPERAGRIMIA